MQSIAGLVSRLPRPDAERQLHVMMAALRRDPDGEIGAWVDESLGVYVGWTGRRAAAVPRLPLRDRRGDLTLVFSGEALDAPDVFGGADRRGDALVRLGAHDPTFPAEVNGRFHGLLIDRPRRTATLFNDRYGLHRVYWHAGTDGVYFAAEAKAILAVRPELRVLDPRGLGEYVSCGCVLENRTLFTGLDVLPGAARWTLVDGRIAARDAYFRPDEWEQQPILSPRAYAVELGDVLSRIVPRYFGGVEPAGVSLTGGVDSRIIMAHRPRRAAIRCYTFGSMFRESHDVRIARRVAEACGQPHRVIRVDEAFLARFAEYAERSVYLSDGCADVSRAPDLYVNALAGEIAPVRMTGNYGSEVLRRNVAFKPTPVLPSLFVDELVREMRQAEATYAGLLRRHRLSFIVFQQLPWHHYGLLRLEESQLPQRSPYLDHALVRTAFRAPPSARAVTAACLAAVAAADPGLLRMPTDRGVTGGGVWEWPCRLMRELEFKAEYKCDYGMPHWLARLEALMPRLRPEHLVLGRHKFLHFRVWYRDALAEHVRSVLLDPQTLALPFLDRNTVQRIVREHLAGQANYTFAINRLLTIELVQRLFVRAGAAAPADVAGTAVLAPRSDPPVIDPAPPFPSAP